MARIFIGIPAYRDPHPATMAALRDLERMNGDHTIGLYVHQGNPYIDVARALCLGMYLKAHRELPGGFDYYMQVDSDVWFPPYALDQLLSHNLDVVNGLYTYKNDDPEGREYKQIVGVLADGAVVDPVTKLVELQRAAGGFMLLKHRVIKRMMKTFQHERVWSLPNFMDPAKDQDEFLETYMWWATLRRPSPPSWWPSGRKWMMVPEDYAFSTRILESGFKMYADTGLYLRHCSGNEYYDLNFGETVLEVKNA